MKNVKTLKPWKKFSPSAHGKSCAKAIIQSEAPGQKSISRSRKKMWTGSGGNKLRKTLKIFDHQLEDIFYITDVVKCQPPNDRDPTPTEIDNCSSFIRREIEIKTPEIILSFGRYALDFLSKNYKSIDQIPSGGITNLHNDDAYLKIKFEKFIVIPLIHPSSANLHIEYAIYRTHLSKIFEKIINVSN